MKDLFWKSYEELSDAQKEDAKRFYPASYLEYKYHFSGVELKMASK